MISQKLMNEQIQLHKIIHLFFQSVNDFKPFLNRLVCCYLVFVDTSDFSGYLVYSHNILHILNSK